jgi:hypothetical protein
MKQRNTLSSGFMVNNFLLLSGIAMIVSGFVLQLGFHIGNQSSSHERMIHSHSANFEQVRVFDPTSTVWNIDYTTWSMLHKAAIVFFTLLMIYHFITHWKWYKGVFGKRLLSKNRQAIILSFLFLSVALTGFIPWFIDLSGNKNLLRQSLIEIHDKLAILFVIYLILHVVKRIKWFKGTYVKLKNK